MTTPLIDSPQGARRSPKRPKQDRRPVGSQNNNSTSESSPSRPTTREASIQPATPHESNSQGSQSALRRKSQGSKKSHNGAQSNRNTSHVPPATHANEPSPDKRATPLKQAYAGPTFHASPAASSLPMPSFYSKSLPSVVASPSLDSTTQLDGYAHMDFDTDKLMPASPEDAVPKARESSPLDFMFEAARKARESPKADCLDTRPGRLSPFDDIPASRARTPGDPSSDSVFPFELDGNGGRSMPIGPAFATPYKDRMEAWRSPKAQLATPAQALDETARKEKSEALKRLLINASPLRSLNQPDMNSYFADRPSNIHSASPSLQPLRHQSSPATPQSGIQLTPVPRNPSPNISSHMPERDTPLVRPMSSHLRREYHPDGHQSPAELDSDSGTPPSISTTRDNNHRSLSGKTINKPTTRPSYPAPKSSIPTRASHSPQKLEDDLCRVLNLDLTSSG